MKVRRGTRNFLHEDAMTPEEMNLCLERGAQCVDRIQAAGCNVVSFGEMGVGNTSASSLWMSCLTGIPLEQCVGAGSGLYGEAMTHKFRVLQQTLQHFSGEHTVEEILCRFGGLEMMMAVGGMLRAAELRMVILVDGYWLLRVCVPTYFRMLCSDIREMKAATSCCWTTCTPVRC